MLKKQLLLFLIVLSLFFVAACGNSTKKIESFPETVNELESYKLTGKLYSMFPTGTKESLITVYYQKPDLYRVELDNSTNGDKQIILKNTDGVHVLLPSVNKSFKLKSGWPINSSYPYLLQSLSKDYVNDEDKVVTKDENTTTVEMDVRIFDNAAVSKEKVIFSNETGLPQEVLIYDETGNLLTRFVFLNIEQNTNIDENLFEKNETMTSSFETFGSIEFTREKTYPTYYPVDTTLKEEKTIRVEDERTYIMTYNGTVNYTIIEQEVIKKDVEVIDYIDGDIYVIGDSFGIINNNTLTFFQSGMEYIVASNEVEMLELIKMGYSLVVYDEK